MSFEFGDRKEDLKAHGVCLLPDVFTDEDVADFRTICMDYFLNDSAIRKDIGMSQPNAAGLLDSLAPYFSDDSIIDAMKDILGEHIIFTGHTSVGINTLAVWHKDSQKAAEPNGTYFCQPAFGVPEALVVKVIWYPQDHTHDDRCLRVRLGSHKTPAIDEGEVLQLHPRPGDVFVMDVRTSHSGLMEPDEYMVKAAAVAREHPCSPDPWRLCFDTTRALYSEAGIPDRLILQSTWGLDNDWVRTFAERNRLRQDAQNGRMSPLTESLRQRLVATGIGTF